MKYEYLHDDRDVFIDYSWERALSIYGDVYQEWCLEFFSTMYFDRGVDRTKLIIDKCIWFRLYKVEKVLTLPEFAVLLGLYEEDKLSHRLFATHFTRLEDDDKLFNHEACWQKIRKPTSLKENSLICRDQYVTKIAHSLGYLNDKEVAKCSEPIECETWTIKMLENELDQGTHSLIQTKQEAPQPWQARRLTISPNVKVFFDLPNVDILDKGYLDLTLSSPMLKI
ncbi:hypothetical protein Tco_0429066 [Tanacetum coccineum]